LIVIEAKMASGLSAGTKHAPTFNQAARNVACIAHLVARAKLEPAAMQLGFVLLAPAERIDQRLFTAVTKEAICNAVTARAAGFDADADAWCRDHFQPVAERCAIDVVALETLLANIEAVDASMGHGLVAFYRECLRHNPFGPIRRSPSAPA
jgi:hypothetical protein